MRRSVFDSTTCSLIIYKLLPNTTPRKIEIPHTIMNITSLMALDFSGNKRGRRKKLGSCMQIITLLKFKNHPIIKNLMSIVA